MTRLVHHLSLLARVLHTYVQSRREHVVLHVYLVALVVALLLNVPALARASTMQTCGRGGRVSGKHLNRSLRIELHLVWQLMLQLCIALTPSMMSQLLLSLALALEVVLATLAFLSGRCQV